MAVYGRSVSLLRQIQTILNEQLGGVDLHGLRRETLGNHLDTTGTIERNSTSPDATASRWRDVLAAVSPSIVQYGNELQRVEEYVSKRSSAILGMARVIWSLEAMVVLIVSMTIGQMLKQSEAGAAGDLAGLAVSIGSVVAFTMVLLAVFLSLNVHVNEMYRKISFMKASPLLTVLRGYSNALCTKQIVVVMAALATGSNAAQALKFYFDSPFASTSGVGPCGTDKVLGPDGERDCVASVDLCKASTMTMAYMVPFIKAYCTAQLVEIADALIDLQQNGVGRYEEVTLWNNVNDGVDAVRMLVETTYDITDPARSLTRETLLAAVQAQVIPLLRLPGVVLRGQFVPSARVLARDGATVDPDAAFSAGGGLIPYSKTPLTRGAGLAAGPVVPQPQCTRACLSGGVAGTSVLSYYDPGSQSCLFSSRYEALANAFVFTGSQSAGTTPTAAGPPAGVLVVVRPTDFVVGGSGSSGSSGSPKKPEKSFDSRVDGPPKSSTYVEITGLAAGAAKVAPTNGDFASYFAPKVSSTVTNASTAPTATVATTAGQLYAYALRSGQAAAQTVSEQASDLAQKLYLVVKQFRFALDLDQVRPMIDAGLRDFYGADLYDTGGVSEAVDGVLHRLRVLVKAGRTASQPKYVTPERLMDKISTFSGDDVTDLTDTVRGLADSATTHRDLFPAYRSTAAEGFASIVTVLGCLIILIAFTSYSLVLYSAFRQHSTMDFDGFMRRVAVSVCVVIITLFVAETLVMKASSRVKHNQNVIDSNGQALVATASGTVSQLDSALKLLNKHPSSPPVAASDAETVRSAAVGLVALSRETIERFDACNSITSGQVGMPLPIAELALYGIIGGLFLVLATLCVMRVEPLAKLVAINSLRAIRARVLRGDPSAVVEAQQAVICSRPPVAIWQFFIWFAILTLIACTAWFWQRSVDVVDDYRNSLMNLGNKCA